MYVRRLLSRGLSGGNVDGVAAARRSTHRSRVLRGPALAAGRAVPRRMGDVRRGGSGRSRRLLLRRGGRRRLEDRRRRRDLEAALRSRGRGVGRRARDRAVGPEGHLRRHRPDPGALRHRLGRRRLPLRATAARPGRTSASPATRAIGRILVDPRDAERRARRGARPHLRPEPRARRLPHRGRRKDLEPGALRGRRARAAPTSPPIRRIPTSCTPSLWQARNYPVALLLPARWSGRRAASTSRSDGGTHVEAARRQGLAGRPTSGGSASPRRRAAASGRWSTPSGRPAARSAAGLYRSDDGGALAGSASTPRRASPRAT